MAQIIDVNPDPGPGFGGAMDTLIEDQARKDSLDLAKKQLSHESQRIRLSAENLSLQNKVFNEGQRRFDIESRIAQQDARLRYEGFKIEANEAERRAATQRADLEALRKLDEQSFQLLLDAPPDGKPRIDPESELGMSMGALRETLSDPNLSPEARDSIRDRWLGAQEQAIQERAGEAVSDRILKTIRSGGATYTNRQGESVTSEAVLAELENIRSQLESGEIDADTARLEYDEIQGEIAEFNRQEGRIKSSMDSLEEMSRGLMMAGIDRDAVIGAVTTERGYLNNVDQLPEDYDSKKRILSSISDLVGIRGDTADAQSAESKINPIAQALELPGVLEQTLNEDGIPEPLTLDENGDYVLHPAVQLAIKSMKRDRSSQFSQGDVAELMPEATATAAEEQAAMRAEALKNLTGSERENAGAMLPDGSPAPESTVWNDMHGSERENFVREVRDALGTPGSKEGEDIKAIAQKYGMEDIPGEVLGVIMSGEPVTQAEAAVYAGSATRESQQELFDTKGQSDVAKLVPTSDGDPTIDAVVKRRREAGELRKAPLNLDEFTRGRNIETSTFGFGGDMSKRAAQKMFDGMKDRWFKAWESGGVGALKSAMLEDSYDPQTAADLVHGEFANRVRQSPEYANSFAFHEFGAKGRSGDRELFGDDWRGLPAVLFSVNQGRVEKYGHDIGSRPMGEMVDEAKGKMLKSLSGALLDVEIERMMQTDDFDRYVAQGLASPRLWPNPQRERTFVMGQGRKILDSYLTFKGKRLVESRSGGATRYSIADK